METEKDQLAAADRVEAKVAVERAEIAFAQTAVTKWAINRVFLVIH